MPAAATKTAGFIERSFEKMRGIRYAVGVRRDLALEDKDLALRTAFAQVVVGATVTQAEFEDRPGQPGDQVDGMFEAAALGLQAADKAVETAHRRLAQKTYDMDCPSG